MEHGRKGTQRIGTWRLHLAHHIHQNGPRLADSHPDVTALIVSAQTVGHLTLRSCHRQTGHMHRSILWHIHIAIRAHRQLLTHLRVTIHIDDQLITRAQHIILRRSNIHHRLKRQRLVVEDIAAKYFFTLFLLLFTKVNGVGTLVHRHVVTIEPTIRTIHHHLLLALPIVIVIGLNLAESTVVFTHAIGRIVNSFVGRFTHAGLLQLTGVLLAHLLYLLQRSTFLK